MAHNFNLSVVEVEAGGLSEFEDSLIYIVSYRLARAYILRLHSKRKGWVVRETEGSVAGYFSQ